MHGTGAALPHLCQHLAIAGPALQRAHIHITAPLHTESRLHGRVTMSAKCAAPWPQTPASPLRRGYVSASTFARRRTAARPAGAHRGTIFRSEGVRRSLPRSFSYSPPYSIWVGCTKNTPYPGARRLSPAPAPRTATDSPRRARIPRTASLVKGTGMRQARLPRQCPLYGINARRAGAMPCRSWLSGHGQTIRIPRFFLPVTTLD